MHAAFNVVLAAALTFAVSAPKAETDASGSVVFDAITENRIVVGDNVTLKSPSAELPETGIEVLLTPIGTNRELDRIGAQRIDAKTIQFQAPNQTGRYLVQVILPVPPASQAGTHPAPAPVPGELVVAPAIPTVSRVEVVRRDLNNGTFDLAISGENLSKDASRVVIDTDHRNAVVARACRSEQDLGPCVKQVEPNAAGRRLDVIGFDPGTDDPSVAIKVRTVGQAQAQATCDEMAMVNGRCPDKRVDLRLTGALGARFWSLAMFAGLLAVVGYILWPLTDRPKASKAQNGADRAQRKPSKIWSIVAPVFLDNRTNSYSLSKFQIVWWISITVFAYVYLFFSRTLVQGNLASLPPVPENLPSLLFLSGATVVGAAAITASVGSKGAGPGDPTRADFISAGGVVMPERLQFFLWTVVAGLGYLAILFLDDPTRVADLPNIPDTLLYLTGVSAATYAGGKLLKDRSGPVITNLAVTDVADDLSSMTMIIQGSGLTTDAKVLLDGNELYTGLARLQPDDASKEDASKRLILTISDKLQVEPCVEGEHTLVLCNSAGQYTTAKFPRDRMSISLEPDQASLEVDAAGPWTIKGKNFAQETHCRLVQGSNVIDALTAWVSQGELKITPPQPLSTGTYRLTLISPVKLRASCELTVI